MEGVRFISAERLGRFPFICDRDTELSLPVIGTPRCTRQTRRGVRPQRHKPWSLWSQKAAQKRTRLFSLASNDASRTFLHFAPEITNLPTRSERLLAGIMLHVSQRDFQKNIRVILAGRRARWTRRLHTRQAPVPRAAPSSAHCSPGLPSADGKGIKNPWWEGV